MQTIGYQGVVDKVSAFYTKFLAQPWQTMFKVFNCCLTTRTSGHDQTKINILQLFHVVVNHKNVDYAALLWWDLLNYVFQKKDVIQYPRFTKLIIVDLMNKYSSIPQILDKDYHSIKDDIPLVSVYLIGNVLFRGMLIPNAFLTDKIRATDDYKKYKTVTPTLTVACPHGKKRNQSVWETSLPRKSLKVTIKQKKQSTTLILPPSDDRERDEITEAALLIQENLAEEEIKKMVEGEEDEESYASEFSDFMFNDDDDSGTRIEPGSQKENLEVVDDDDVTKKKDDKKDEDEEKDDDVEKMGDDVEEKDNADHTNQTLVGTHATGSMETNNKQMQTPIPTPN
ncbi:hypothetical protein Tco_0654104 [Tanacetum coccineum]|uniref:Uncharacterized protein n=1 Tax=Tanacetum coccineum TaxID=301880 RepID=A0ABQ4X337_9ASTR